MKPGGPAFSKMERPLTAVASVPHASALSRLQWSCPIYNQDSGAGVVRSGQDKSSIFESEDQTKIGGLEDWSALLDEISVDFTETESVNNGAQFKNCQPLLSLNEEENEEALANDESSNTIEEEVEKLKLGCLEVAWSFLKESEEGQEKVSEEQSGCLDKEKEEVISDVWENCYGVPNTKGASEICGDGEDKEDNSHDLSKWFNFFVPVF